MSMYCDECGTAMHWRCTDNVTNVSKFKCPRCGNVQTGELKRVEPKPPKEPKYYYESGDGKWIVRRVINCQPVHVGSFADEETAKRVVDGMKKVNWDKSMVPMVFKSLGIHKVKRSWVCE